MRGYFQKQGRLFENKTQKLLQIGVRVMSSANLNGQTFVASFFKKEVLPVS
jgi:hypothetical protein